MLEIVINGESLDLYPDETIEINMKQSDVKDFAVNFNSFTREFTIPASPKNNRILKEYWNPSVMDQHLTNNNIPTSLFINKVLFRRGSIKIAKATVQNTITTNYTISFTTDLVSMKDSLSGVKINELNLTALGVTTRFPYSDQFIYPRFPQQNSYLEFPLITTKYLTSDYKYENINSDGITKDMIRPAIKIKNIINKFPGHSINQGSFIDDPIYEDLYLWLNGSEDIHAGDIRLLNVQEGIYQNQFRDFMGVWINRDDITDIQYNFEEDYVYFTNDNYIYDTATLRVNITGNYKLHIQRLILNDDYSINEQRTRTQDNQGIKESPERSGTSQLTLSGVRLEGTRYGYRFYFQPLGTISVNGYTIEASYNVYGANYHTRTYKKSNIIVYPTPFVLNPEFEISKHLPDITCYDLIISLVKMFNLIISPGDVPNTLKLDYYSSFFDTNEIDLTTYVDNSYEVSTPPIPNNLTFKHSENDFYLNQMWKNNQSDNRGYGDVVLSGLTNNSTETQEVVSKFSTLPFFEWESNPEIRVSTIENESQEPVWGTPILLVNNGLTTSVGDKLAYKHDNGSSYPIAEWKHFDMVHLATGKSILFSNDIPEVDGLYQSNYKLLTERLYSPYNRFVNIEAMLPRHLYNMGLGSTIIVNDKRYTIDEMKLNLISGKVNLKLNNVRDYVKKEGYSIEKIRGLRYQIKVPQGINQIEIFHKAFGQLYFNSFEMLIPQGGVLVFDMPRMFNQLQIKVDGVVRFSYRNNDYSLFGG